MARQLDEDGYRRAGESLKKNSRFVVTFAELALLGIKIPYTTNRIERLMGEVSKRCKHKWMHWSTVGLKDILTIVLRYTNKSVYEDFKKHISKTHHSPEQHTAHSNLQLHSTKILTVM
jgi:transposase-like protein